MQPFNKIMLSVIIVAMAITQIFQGLTIANLNKTIAAQARINDEQMKINKANGEASIACSQAISFMGEAIKTTNKTIRAMYR